MFTQRFLNGIKIKLTFRRSAGLMVISIFLIYRCIFYPSVKRKIFQHGNSGVPMCFRLVKYTCILPLYFIDNYEYHISSRRTCNAYTIYCRMNILKIFVFLQLFLGLLRIVKVLLPWSLTQFSELGCVDRQPYNMRLQRIYVWSRPTRSNLQLEQIVC